MRAPLIPPLAAAATAVAAVPASADTVTCDPGDRASCRKKGKPRRRVTMRLV